MMLLSDVYYYILHICTIFAILNICAVTAIYHKRSRVHSIFQISISRNTKCIEIVGFPRDCHIYQFLLDLKPRL